MIAELAENASVHSLLPHMKDSKILREPVVAFGRRKEKKATNYVPCSELYLFLAEFSQY